jgi:long-chain acyl-CoA synthetase
MKTLAEMLEAVIGAHSGRTALVTGTDRITYRQLEERIAGLAHDLRSQGVKPGDRAALLLPNGVDFVVGYFALTAMGAIIIPMNEHYQETEIEYLLEECDVSLILTSQESKQLCQTVLAHGRRTVRIVFAPFRRCKGAPSRLWEVTADIDPEQPLMCQFSSGSTGKPKRIARNHRQILFELDSLVETLRLSPEDRFLGAAPFSHVNGLMRSMMASLRAGATLYPVPRFERQKVVELIESEKITVYIGVPFMFSMLAKSVFRKQPNLTSLRLCCSASAPMPPNLNQLFQQKFGLYVRQLYGSTETGTISVNLSPSQQETLDSVGTPIRGVDVQVFRDDGSIETGGEMGELGVRSPAAITGYVDMDELNREVFRCGYFLTGDLGRKDSNGVIYLLGRKKFFINKGGYKINPHDIEEVLESHPSVEEAVVIGLPTDYGDEKIKAVLVLKAPCTQEEIVEHCRGKIAHFKVPGIIEFTTALPKTSTGKVRRGMLKEAMEG